jgi:hypothetical protein
VYDVPASQLHHEVASVWDVVGCRKVCIVSGATAAMLLLVPLCTGERGDTAYIVVPGRFVWARMLGCHVEWGQRWEQQHAKHSCCWVCI